MKKLSLKKFIRNVYIMFTEDISNKEINKLVIENEENADSKRLYHKIILSGIFQNHQLEVSNLLAAKETIVYPYKQIKSIPTFDSGVDKQTNLPFVVHNGKKLYFPTEWPLKKAIEEYISYIEEENLLGGDYSEKSPHQYQSEAYCVKDGDIVFDLGCAEGLFALDIVDKAKKLYLFEPNPKWMPALKATFEPYKDKVSIINKFVSADENKTSTTLSAILEKEKKESLFVKMDIEGHEVSVLESSEQFLIQDLNICFTCCTYHKHDDAKKLTAFFNKLNYHSEFSDGFILFTYDKEIKFPYFRKGLIRASKI